MEGLLVGGLVEWAKGLDPLPTLIHIDMREPQQEGVGHKAMATAAACPPRVEGCRPYPRPQIS